MKITIITSERFSQFPPMITAINVLAEMENDLTIITPAYDEYLVSHRSVKHLWVQKHYVKTIEDTNMGRVKASIAHRLNILQKRVCLNCMHSMFRKEIEKSAIVWLFHERTALYGGKAFLNRIGEYYYTIYELCVSLYGNKKIYEYAAKKAKKIVVPEYNRAHILKAVYQLDYLPYVIPNTSFDISDASVDSIDETTEKIIQEILSSGRKIIMYMGILSPERPLDPLIDAISKVRNEYEFVVVGQHTTYLEKLLKSKKELFTYLGYFNPPTHLQIAKQAHIAYVGYVPQGSSINAVFCAPNKIYEFARFGIPLICNDVPGLKYQVESNGFGLCISDFNEDTIIEVIKNIEKHYEEMSNSARNFHKSVDIKNLYNKVLKCKVDDNHNA